MSLLDKTTIILQIKLQQKQNTSITLNNTHHRVLRKIYEKVNTVKELTVRPGDQNRTKTAQQLVTSFELSN